MRSRRASWRSRPRPRLATGAGLVLGSGMRFARRVARLAIGSAIVCAFAACPGLVAADAAGAAQRCSAKDLAVWLDDAPGGAGMSHRVFFIDFANLSTHPCVLSGYPRVVPLDVHGHQVS